MPVNSPRLLPATRVFLFACLLLLATTSTAQTNAPLPTPAPTPPTAPTSAALPSVKLNVIITDAAKHTVAGLRAEDFRVTEDGVPQTLTAFAGDTAPVSYGLVVDTSGSLRQILSTLNATSRSIVAANQPGDETFIVSFISSDKIKTLQTFTSDQASLLDALDGMYSEGGLTALVDAVYFAAKLAAERRPDDATRRRALVLITDGEDRASFHKFDELLDFLRRQQVQVFCVALTQLQPDDPLFHKGMRAKAEKLLDTLASETGGRALYPKDSTEVRSVVAQLNELLRRQYVLGYTPTNAALDGKYRKVEVKLNEPSGNSKRTVTARAGYTAPGNPSQEKPRGKG